MLYGNDRDIGEQSLLEVPQLPPARGSRPAPAGKVQGDGARESVHAKTPAQQEVPVGERPGREPPTEIEERRRSPDSKKPRASLMRRHPIALVFGAVLLIPAVAGGYLYFDYAGHFESTDDAFIAARQFAIAPKVSGYVTAVPVTDNQHVAAGDVIARIDDRDYRIALDAGRGAGRGGAGQHRATSTRRSPCSRRRSPRAEAQVEQAQAGAGLRPAAGGALPGRSPSGARARVQNAQQYASQLSQQQAARQDARRPR